MGNVVVDSKRLGALTDTQLQRALDRFDLAQARAGLPAQPRPPRLYRRQSAVHLDHDAAGRRLGARNRMGTWAV
jgi:hypothetical protein